MLTKLLVVYVIANCEGNLMRRLLSENEDSKESKDSKDSRASGSSSWYVLICMYVIFILSQHIINNIGLTQ